MKLQATSTPEASAATPTRWFISYVLNKSVDEADRPVEIPKFGTTCLPRITIITQPNERSSELAINVIDDESK
jgi:hypothetical protein